MTFRRLAAVLVLFVGGACANIAGLGDYGAASTTGGGTSTGAGGGTGGSEELGCPAAPAGWQGPAAVHLAAEDAPPCEGPWAEALEGGITPVPASCSCNCDVTPNATDQAQLCANVGWDVHWSANPGCGMAVEAVAGLATNTCHAPTPLGAPVASVLVAPSAGPMEGICVPDDPNGIRGEPTFAQNARICTFDGALDAPTLCEREVPSGYPARLCVFKSGDVAEPCPAGYPDRETIATEIADNSTCTCSCTDNGVACQGLFELHDDIGCQFLARESFPTDGSCHDVPDPDVFPGFEVHFDQVGGTCGAVHDVQGTPEELAYATICCE